jgi:hypothetical protein
MPVGSSSILPSGLATDPAASPVTIGAVEVTFQTLIRSLGVAVGEHLGYLLTGLWTALVGVAAGRWDRPAGRRLSRQA